METWLGMDVGGTKLLIGEMNADGVLLRQKRYETGYPDQETGTHRMAEALTDYLAYTGTVGTPKRVGVGITGIVDPARGVWVAMDHIRQQPVALAERLSAVCGLPVAVENDVRSATCAVRRFGQGRDLRAPCHFIYLNVGTGIAAGIVTEGCILRGANHNSGEIGHMVVSPETGVTCVCGRIGCVEAIASGSGFTARIRAAHAAGMATRLSPIPEGRGADIRELFSLADGGDPLAQKLTDEAAVALARAILNLVRVTDPEQVVLGGGILSDGWLLPKVKAHFHAPTLRGVTAGVVLSALDAEHTGLIGACTLAMEMGDGMEGETR